MTIQFFFIAGINDNNTIHFTGAAERDTYFSNRVLRSITYSFFPPKYTDTLKVSITDITLDTNVNYLRFEWNGRYYYYFLDSVEYVNEDVIELNIRMDTVMTYYTDLRVRRGVIERKHIDRWDNDNINRDYIRENFSDGLFVPSNKVYLVEPGAMKWLIIKTTAEIRVSQTKKRSTYVKPPLTEENVLVPYGLYVGPMVNKEVNITYADAQTLTVTYPFGSLMLGEKDDRVLNVFVSPFNPVNEIHLDEETGSYLAMTCDWTKDHNEDSLVPYVTNTIDLQGSGELAGYFAQLSQKVYSNNVSANSSPISFAKNTALDVAYNKRFIPQLFDSNYIRFTYGSETANVAYPIEYMETAPGSSNLILKYTISLDNGVKTYWVYDSSVTDEYKYSSIAIDTNVAQMPLANDPWQKYLANAHSRLMSTGIDMFSSAASCFVDVATISAAAKVRKMRISSDFRNWDKRTTRAPRLKRKPSDRIHAIEDEASIDTMESLAGLGRGIIGAMGSEIGNAATAMWSAPTQKQTGNFLDGDASAQLAIWYQWSVVQDIEFVAQFYHQYGNLVNKIYPTMYNWYDYFTSRYYFNYFKFADVDIYLLALSEESVCQDIERRFKEGITLWNKDFAIGSTLNKDNIENSIL